MKWRLGSRLVLMYQLENCTPIHSDFTTSRPDGATRSHGHIEGAGAVGRLKTASLFAFNVTRACRCSVCQVRGVLPNPCTYFQNTQIFLRNPRFDRVPSHGEGEIVHLHCRTPQSPDIYVELRRGFCLFTSSQRFFNVVDGARGSSRVDAITLALANGWHASTSAPQPPITHDYTYSSGAHRDV